jgi:uncharacterized protein
MSESPSFEEMTLRQLRRVASAVAISRYSRMRKEDLVAEIQRRLAAGAVYDSTLMTANSTPLDDNELDMATLATVDDNLGELPGGYGEARISLLPRDPQWAYAYWDTPASTKEELRRQGGQQLALRLYDITDIDINATSPHGIQEYPLDEMTREWYLPIPVSDRDYLLDIGYRCADGRWLTIARSTPARVPPVYPSDWIEDIFITVNWEDDLRGTTVAELVPPARKAALSAEAAAAAAANPIYDDIFNVAPGGNVMHVAGSLFGSMHQVPTDTLSSFVFPSGMGMWALPTASGVNMSGVGMSGIGMETSAKPRKFWLIADAELIVYGATEPDAKVYVGGREIELSPNGTFRFQMSFPDGEIDYPIVAVAADGEQQRSIRMTFDRETTNRNTNTKEEAVEEWFFVPQ